MQARREPDRERREENREEREESGRLGGSAAMAAGMPRTYEDAEVMWLTAPVVRWGPVWAGLIVALGIQFVLSALGAAIALSGLDPNQANYAEDLSVFLSVWLGISLLIALFFGGWVAGRGGALLGMRYGWFQGTVVWALAVLFGLLFGSAITSGLLGMASNLVPAMQGMQAGAAQVGQAVAPERLINTAASTAWVFFFASILQWGAAALGGKLGANRVMERSREA